MEKKHYAALDESVWHATLGNGLNIYVDQKSDYHKQFAFFATNYGGMNMRFRLKGEDWQDTPAGVAHFLEHKMFDTEDGNALQILAANGVDPNAFTSSDITGYYFEGSEKFEENLRTLLSFVSVPWFTKESVDKEQGIIGQEIRMYEDDPNWRVFFNTLEVLYVNNPVRRDIAGTIESIAQIDDKLLYDCYNTFYNLNNMVLGIAGKFEIDDVFEIMDKTLNKSEQIGITTKTPDEPQQVCKPEVVQNLEVAVPLFTIGFKEQVPDKDELVKVAVETDILLELIAGKSSALYRRLYDEGLINQTFSCETVNGRGFFCTMFEGESRNPRKVKQEILKEIERLKAHGIDEGDFSRIKKAHYGQSIRDFTNPTKVANSLVNSYFCGCSVYDFIDATSKVTLSDVAQRLQKTFMSERSVISIVEKN